VEWDLTYSIALVAALYIYLKEYVCMTFSTTNVITFGVTVGVEGWVAFSPVLQR
jgi:hypothetical protein